MKNQFYCIKILDKPEVVHEMESQMTSDQLERAGDIDVSVLDVVIDGYINSYVCGDMLSINEMCGFLGDMGIKYHRSDISDDIVLQNITFDDDEFKELANEYIRENLTSDMVLDKINMKGIKSLTDIDKEVLSFA
jgi:hypothetical protein